MPKMKWKFIKQFLGFGDIWECSKCGTINMNFRWFCGNCGKFYDENDKSIEDIMKKLCVLMRKSGDK